MNSGKNQDGSMHYLKRPKRILSRTLLVMGLLLIVAIPIFIGLANKAYAKTQKQFSRVSVGRSGDMTEVTYYVALPFVASDDGVAAGEPTECFNPVAVVMRAEALSRGQAEIARRGPLL
jgi:hypothetical protein